MYRPNYVKSNSNAHLTDNSATLGSSSNQSTSKYKSNVTQNKLFDSKKKLDGQEQTLNQNTSFDLSSVRLNISSESSSLLDNIYRRVKLMPSFSSVKGNVYDTEELTPTQKLIMCLSSHDPFIAMNAISIASDIASVKLQLLQLLKLFNSPDPYIVVNMMQSLLNSASYVSDGTSTDNTSVFMLSSATWRNIATSIIKYEGDKEYCANAFKFLINVVTQPGSEKWLVSYGIIPILVDGIQSPSTDVLFQHYLAQFFCNLVLKISICHEDQVYVNVLNNFKLSQALRLLLERCAAHLLQVETLGFTLYILTTMSFNKEAREVLQQDESILKPIATIIQDESLVMSHPGVIQRLSTLFDMYIRHPNHLDILANAGLFIFLRNSLDSKNYRFDCLDLNKIDNIKLASLATIGNLALVELTSDTSVVYNHVESSDLLNAIQTPLRDPNDSFDVKLQCITATCNLMTIHSFQQPFIDSGGINVLIDTALHYTGAVPQSKEMQMYSKILGSFYHMTLYSDHIRSVLVEASLVNFLLNVIDHNVPKISTFSPKVPLSPQATAISSGPDFHENLLYSTLRCLSNLSLVNNGSKEISQSKCLDLLISILLVKPHPMIMGVKPRNQDDFLTLVIGIFENLSFTEAFIQALCNQGRLKSILELLEGESLNLYPNLQNHILKFFAKLASNSKIQKNMNSLHALHIFEKLQISNKKSHTVKCRLDTSALHTIINYLKMPVVDDSTDDSIALLEEILDQFKEFDIPSDEETNIDLEPNVVKIPPVLPPKPAIEIRPTAIKTRERTILKPQLPPPRHIHTKKFEIPEPGPSQLVTKADIKPLSQQPPHVLISPSVSPDQQKLISPPNVDSVDTEIPSPDAKLDQGQLDESIVSKTTPIPFEPTITKSNEILMKQDNHELKPTIVDSLTTLPLPDELLSPVSPKETQYSLSLSDNCVLSKPLDIPLSIKPSIVKNYESKPRNSPKWYQLFARFQHIVFSPVVDEKQHITTSPIALHQGPWHVNEEKETKLCASCVFDYYDYWCPSCKSGDRDCERSLSELRTLRKMLIKANKPKMYAPPDEPHDSTTVKTDNNIISSLGSSLSPNSLLHFQDISLNSSTDSSYLASSVVGLSHPGDEEIVEHKVLPKHKITDHHSNIGCSNMPFSSISKAKPPPPNSKPINSSFLENAKSNTVGYSEGKTPGISPNLIQLQEISNDLFSPVPASQAKDVQLPPSSAAIELPVDLKAASDFLDHHSSVSKQINDTIESSGIDHEVIQQIDQLNSDDKNDTPTNQPAGDETNEERKRYVRRTKIVQELFQTEMDYINSLWIVLKKYHSPLLNALDLPKPLIREADLRSIFSSIEIIHSINLMLLVKLNQRMQQWSPIQTIGDVFIEMMDLFKVYTDYINHYDISQSTLYRCRGENAMFNRFLLEQITNDDQNKLGLEALLIMPIQRPPRYSLLLRELIKYTPDSHPDWQNLNMANEKMTNITSYLNEKRRDFENRQVLFDLNQSLTNAKGKYQIIEPHRISKISAKVNWNISGKSKQHSGNLYIFNDILVLTKLEKNFNRQKVVYWITFGDEHQMVIQPGSLSSADDSTSTTIMKIALKNPNEIICCQFEKSQICHNVYNNYMEVISSN